MFWSKVFSCTSCFDYNRVCCDTVFAAATAIVGVNSACNGTGDILEKMMTDGD